MVRGTAYRGAEEVNPTGRDPLQSRSVMPSRLGERGRESRSIYRARTSILDSPDPGE